MNNKELVMQINELDERIKSYNLSDEDRKKERRELLHKYNDVKDGALKVFSLLAEIEQKSLGRVLAARNINFDKSS